ncbi:MAG TPA: 23S rRNA (guanosine(2251)-2'-O)-methyltransferase RlmB, partial [Candidatus Hydrogenedentes bacterium]|nr:23S rRNA (guanosine(2251)-2'-O)-methyltransferase RlmB [Candidatus Hydrogenedentota bacterium]
LDAAAPQALWDADLRGRVGLVVGSEGGGIRRLVREQCDFELRIPLVGPIESLNASVSAAIALAECMRQRVKKRP